MSLSRQLLTILLCSLSLFCLFKAGFLTIQQFLIVPSDYQFQVHAQTATAADDRTPQRIVIADENIDLPITPTPLDAGEWQISTQGVSLLQPENAAPSQGWILYGHNWPVLLGRLKNAKIGQEIALQYTGEKREHYIIQSIFTVDPQQLSILDLAQPNTLLLYTCTGLLDTQRLVVVAQRS